MTMLLTPAQAIKAHEEKKLIYERTAGCGPSDWQVHCSNVWDFDHKDYKLADCEHDHDPRFKFCGTFGWAIEQLHEGHRVSRHGWNGKGMYLELQNSKCDGYLTFISMLTVDGDRVPWTASQTDILSEDWGVTK